MSFTASVRKKHIFGGIVLGGAALAAAMVVLPPPADRQGPVQQAPQRNAQAAAPERFAALPAREPMGKARGQLFGPLAAPVHERQARNAAVVQAPPQPVAPPVPYRVAGQVVHDGAMEVVLANGERVSTVREGDVLDETYRVQSITPDSVTLVYLPLNMPQQIQVSGMKLDLERPRRVLLAAGSPRNQNDSAAAGASRPAQLRWEGPNEVQAGKNFNVALKLTSEEPVLASPLQLSFDAMLLQPVAVRAGGFLADGSFSYRVNPGGSIFVGAASGTGSVAADAEFLIVTFKPIRSGAAELKLSSVVLQGAAGRAIVHAPPTAFRTSIVQ
jgi:hypothetical protein